MTMTGRERTAQLARGQRMKAAVHHLLVRGPAHAGHFLDAVVDAAVQGAYPGEARKKKLTTEIKGARKAVLQYLRRYEKARTKEGTLRRPRVKL